MKPKVRGVEGSKPRQTGSFVSCWRLEVALGNFTGARRRDQRPQRKGEHKCPSTLNPILSKYSTNKKIIKK